MAAVITFKSVMDGEDWRCRPFLLLDTPSGHQEAALSGITPRRQTLFDLAGRIVGARPLPLAEAVACLKAAGMQSAHIAELFGAASTPHPELVEGFDASLANRASGTIGAEKAMRATPEWQEGGADAPGEGWSAEGAFLQ